MTLAAVFVLIFFTVYAASCFVTCGKLFSTLFGAPYMVMMLVGAIFVLLYTVLGGFLAESALDFMQGIVMITALAVIVIISIVNAGGIDAVIENGKEIPGFLEFFGMATPEVNADGVQLVEAGKPAFIVSSIVIVVVSLVTAPPSKAIEEDFEAVKSSVL